MLKNLHKIVDNTREMFPSVFTVPEAIEIYDTQKKGTPISHFAPKSKAGKSYEKIAKSIMVNTKTKIKTKTERRD